MERTDSYNACKVALDCIEAIQELNNKIDDVEIGINIGIATGKVIYGIFGSKYRKYFGTLGPIKNMTSRLHGTNKVYNTNIIVNDEVYNQQKNNFIFRLLDNVMVKGHKDSMDIYELCGT